VVLANEELLQFLIFFLSMPLFLVWSFWQIFSRTTYKERRYFIYYGSEEDSAYS